MDRRACVPAFPGLASLRRAPPLASLLLIAMACTPTHQWVHPEYTDDQRRRDLRFCERRAAAAAPIAYRTIRPEQFHARHRPSSDYLGPYCGHRCAEKRAGSYNREQQRLSTPRVESYRVVDDRVTADCMRAFGYAYQELAR